MLLGSRGALLQRLANECAQAGYYYAYMMFGSIAAFALFGYFLGQESDMLEEEKKRATILAITDGLTGLYNHRYLHQHLAAEAERAQRYRTPLTCLMLDLDNFKKINDTHGHPFGDEVLKIVARIIREQVRRVDTAGRYGGEEFLVLMPHTVSSEALPVAERIRTEVQEFPFRCDSQDVHLTVSIGMATYNALQDASMNKSDLLKAADDALYQAKRDGKNKTLIGSYPDRFSERMIVK
jgi:diguanylate cyclase (GGDEF)-like protein